ncbi:uncharacterized protein C8Q71DRAFT_708478 [Rhodofomes roseus]|uniref:CxC2-like cysteine cluster KDZ transposase-associated domain-containing protein n=1 Tax=Rhodofomes roseus TaxID=34475 RepID=A0ABQ8KG02_9APHY|nr:uncharacterized protein C8Q71DRAFT_708478 [Rhodofomes roseus]KAH9836221.1 hypothetical protein C8Q71DRAFT_708478 [Rhodofomes roseus]
MGFTAQECPTCDTGGIAEYRCSDCADLQLYCAECTVRHHSRNPLHRLAMWVKTHFCRADLKKLGVRIQLGHPTGERCPNPKRAFNDDFVILDITGVHHVGLDYCDCPQKVHLPHQLMRARLFPATVTNPKTAATYHLMEHFHLLRTQSKISAYEFYQGIARQTDNVSPEDPADRYPAFLRMSRAWSHLKMLKRGGRGHDPSGASGTSPGECAVECPACPQPEKNLPADWKNAPKAKSWLYRLFVGLDANFRLKRKKVSNSTVDPGLNKGYAYFVEETAYKAFLHEFDTKLPPEKNTCHNHDAVKLANIKKVRETDASGVATVECTRHDMKRPCSVGDLQYGERYVNMDYLYFSSLEHHSMPEIVTSYDIACQWSRNLSTRHDIYNAPFDCSHHRINFLIPKFHLPAHQSSCQYDYSFNNTPGVGRTDGEAVERGWAAVNPFATSTKEMGPGHRRDVLDDVFGAYNWGKVRQLAPTLLKKVKTAVDKHVTHQQAFDDFTQVLPAESVQLWTTMVEKWEDDPEHNPNPFAATEPTVTMAAVRRALAEEEAALLHKLTNLPIYRHLTDGHFTRRRLRADVKKLGDHSTDNQRATVLERANALRRKLEAWFKIQQVYIPGAENLRTIQLKKADIQNPAAFNLPLLLPSAISSTLELATSLRDIEWRLRHAQAHDALSDLRKHLRMRSHLYQFKDRFVRGQHANTRARSVIDNVQHKVDEDADRYRRARAALLSLSCTLGKTGWEETLKVLGERDVRGMTAGTEEEEQEQQSEGNRTLSWIWRSTPIVGPEDAHNPDLQEGLRIEWCKSRARANRWDEEVDLLREEMRRVVRYHSWKARQWLDNADARPTLAANAREGLSAYAHRQAEIRTTMRSVCAHGWRYVDALISIGEAELSGEDPPSSITESDISA